MSFRTPIQGTAGWFDDPHTPGITRYWDGSRWTDRSFGEPLVYAPPPTGGGRPLGSQYPPGFVPSTDRPPVAGATTDSTAIWALVLAIIGCFWGVPGIVLGGKSKRQIKYSGGRLNGEGLATAAQIIGWIWVVISVASVIFALANADNQPTYYPPPSTVP